MDPSQFELGGAPHFKLLTGIGVAKNEPGLRAQLTVELHAMIKDGTYRQDLQKVASRIRYVSQ
jgi:ABC-type amino acid transport substrate-binding protein